MLPDAPVCRRLWGSSIFQSHTRGLRARARLFRPSGWNRTASPLRPVHAAGAFVRRSLRNELHIVESHTFAEAETKASFREGFRGTEHLVVPCAASHCMGIQRSHAFVFPENIFLRKTSILL
jgi:hypothetical protein